jgi:hypothetical protein
MGVVAYKQQHMLALERANAARTAMMAERKRLKALSYDEGCLEVSLLLLHPPQQFQAFKMLHLLGSIQSVGPKRARIWLRRIGCRSFDYRLRELTERQRRLLAEILRVDR